VLDLENRRFRSRLFAFGAMALPRHADVSRYRYSTCTSVINHVVCHCVPGDLGAEGGDRQTSTSPPFIVEGWYGDSSRM